MFRSPTKAIRSAKLREKISNSAWLSAIAASVAAITATAIQPAAFGERFDLDNELLLPAPDDQVCAVWDMRRHFHEPVMGAEEVGNILFSRR